MTNEEAIEFLSLVKTNASQIDEAIEIAIEALEKQMPREPISVKYYGAEGYSHRCPDECQKHGGYVCVSAWQNYCPNCGQAIDWSDAK